MNKKDNKLEQVVRYCTTRINKFTEEQIVQVISKLKQASPKVAMKFLTQKAMMFYDVSSKEFALMLKQIYKLNDGSYSNAQAIVNEIQKEQELNLPEDGQTLEENHKTLKESLKLVCDKFNELGIDYYIGGALSVYLIKGELIRYHDDIDFVVNENDLPKVAEALKGTPFEFHDYRLDSPKLYDEQGNLTNGAHEVIATRKDNEFHLGFFLFSRKKDVVETREYHAKLGENGEKIPQLFIRDKTSTEIFDLEHNGEFVEQFGTKFKCSAPESVCEMKRYTKRQKDLLDVEQWTSWGMMDEQKIKHIYALKEEYIKQKEETKEENDKKDDDRLKDVSSKLREQILNQQKEIQEIQKANAQGLQIEI